eukprot:s6784_g4.t1
MPATGFSTRAPKLKKHCWSNANIVPGSPISAEGNLLRLNIEASYQCDLTLAIPHIALLRPSSGVQACLREQTGTRLPRPPSEDEAAKHRGRRHLKTEPPDAKVSIDASLTSRVTSNSSAFEGVA